jgi:CRISPR-associated protein Cmr3
MERMVKRAFWLEPVDTLFFRGGRPLVASIPGVSTLPSPQTLAGAMTTAALRLENALDGIQGTAATRADALERLGAGWLAKLRWRGPWLAKTSMNGEVTPYVNMPRDVRQLAGGKALTRLQLRSGLPGWSSSRAGAKSALWPSVRLQDLEKTTPGLLSFGGLGQYLKGEVPQLSSAGEQSDFCNLEERIGIGIAEGQRVTEQGKIYSTKSLRFKPRAGFYGEVEVSEQQATKLERIEVIHWGGERKLCRVQWIQPVEIAQPKEGANLLLLITAAFFDGRNGPSEWGEDRLEGLALAGGYNVSGWDLASGSPKPTRFGVEAGSVYFFRNPLEAGENWPQSNDDAALGYGCSLKGMWHRAKQ